MEIVSELKSLSRSHGPSVVAKAISSFAISVVRVSGVIAFGFYALLNTVLEVDLVVFLIVGVMVLDHYDGKVFDSCGLNTLKKWRVRRRLLDSVSDRVAIHVTCLTILVLNLEFLPFYAVILFREVLISGFCAHAFNHNTLIYPNNIAKLSAILVGMTAIFFVVGSPFLLFVSTSFLIITSVFSFNDYRNRALEHWQVYDKPVSRHRFSLDSIDEICD